LGPPRETGQRDGGMTQPIVRRGFAEKWFAREKSYVLGDVQDVVVACSPENRWPEKGHLDTERGGII